MSPPACWPPLRRRRQRSIAEATGGTYSEVADGAALQRELSRTALRAYRAFQPTGKRVTGTPTSADAPAISTGQYVDELGKGEIAHYRLERPRDARVYVAATLVPPRGDYDRNSLEGVSVRISTAEGVCVQEFGAAEGQGEGVAPVTTVASFTDNAGQSGRSAYGCDQPGTYDVAVERTNSGVPEPTGEPAASSGAPVAPTSAAGSGAAEAPAAADDRTAFSVDGSTLRTVAYVGGGIVASMLAGALLLAPWLRRRGESR